jgi:hypothetical protein
MRGLRTMIDRIEGNESALELAFQNSERYLLGYLKSIASIGNDLFEECEVGDNWLENHLKKNNVTFTIEFARKCMRFDALLTMSMLSPKLVMQECDGINEAIEYLKIYEDA